MLASPQRFRNQRIGENKPCFHHVVDRQQDFRNFTRDRLAEAKPCARALCPEEFAAEALAAVDRRQHLDVCDVAGVAIEIGAAHQRPVDAGRRDFQAIGAFDRVAGIKHRRKRARGGFAILDGHGSVRPLGHDLNSAAGGGGNSHTDQPIAETGEHRLGDRGNARRPPRLDDQPRFFGKGCRPVVHAP